MKYKFKRNVTIGSIEAENDNFLIKSFVEKPEYKIIKDTNDQRFILLGNTGTGKTAILRHLEEEETDKYVRSRINPDEMSLRFLSNSDILKYFIELGVNLDLFYKFLWKHVLLVEVLKFICKTDDASWITNLLDRVKTVHKDKQKLENYLSKYKYNFWETTEFRVKEIVNDVKKNLEAEVGMSIGDLKKMSVGINSKHKHSKSNSEKVTQEVIHKCQKVVNSVQIGELSDVIRILKNGAFTKRKQLRYYIIIDDLDKEWIDTSLVYELIKSLIDSIKDLRFENVKIIIALRENLYQKVLDYSRHQRGVQQEKYDSCVIKITWNENELINLVEKRLASLMKDSYTNATPSIQDVFGKPKKNFKYILDRSLMRPRYVIDFVNKCILHSDGNTIIPPKAVKLAEKDYSQKRLISIFDEWRENYPFLKDATKLLQQRKNVFPFIELKESIVDDNEMINILSKIIAYKDKINNQECLEAFEKYEKDMDGLAFLLLILQIFYDVGLIGVKANAESKTLYSYINPFKVEEEIGKGSKIYINETFHKALNINASYKI